MAALGIGVSWVAYSAILYGYCLFRGYNITPKQLMSRTWPPGAAKNQTTGSVTHTINGGDS